MADSPTPPEQPAAKPPPRAPFGLNSDRRHILYAILAAIVVFAVGAAIRPGFASFAGLSAVLVVASFVGLVAAGQTFVILIGGIDLSIPSVLNAAAILLVTSTLGDDSRAFYGIALTLGMGAGIGLLNGIGVALLGVPAVIMTLAMNGIVEGLMLGLSGGLTCQSCASYAPSVVQAAVHGTLFGVPLVLYIWALIAIAVSVVLSLTTFGRRTYAIGNNPVASHLAGINVPLTTVLLYALSGIFAALAGILLVGFGGQASLGMGTPYLFESIAAAVVGGISILGGRGHYLGAAAGAVSLVALTTVLQTVNMPEYGRDILYGVVVIVLLLAYGRENDSA
jgi:ribose transport system permease protein